MTATTCETTQGSPSFEDRRPSPSGDRLTVRAAPPEHFAWIIERTGCAPTAGFRAIEAVDAAGRILGMIAYDGWTETSCQAHMAVDSPIAWRALLRPTFAYPFEEAGRSVLLGLICSNNSRSRRMAKRLGMREVYSVRDGHGPGVDLVLVEMRKEECAWLGRERRKVAA